VKPRFRFRGVPIALALAGATALAAGCSSSAASSGTSGGSLTSITFATASSAPTPLFENIYIAQQLGFFKQQGMTVNFVNMGGNAQVTSAIGRGQAQVGVGVPNFQVTTKASGQSLPGVDYYEYTYPSKWFLVIPPNSSITSISQLAGKKIGITSLGTADEQVMDSLLQEHGVNPKSVKYQVVGQTNAGGIALSKDQLDASLVWDSVLGAYDVAGIKYKILLSPSGIQKVGGFFLQASPTWLKNNQKLAVGFARAVSEATVYAVANPQAAAAAYLQMFPAAATTESKQQQVNDIVRTVKYRASHWTPYTSGSQLGYIQPSEFKNEVAFASAQSKISDPTQFYTNNLISQIDNYSASAIQAEAKASSGT
jgi:NitT/TauT family transport system substrate-binding protein